MNLMKFATASVAAVLFAATASGLPLDSVGSGSVQQYTCDDSCSCSPDGSPVAWNDLNGYCLDNTAAAGAMAATEPMDDDGQRGAIVNMASAAAFDGQIGQAAYSASKGGIVGMTLPIARDLSVVGVRVNTIAPGLIDTPIYGEGEQSDAFKAHLGQSVLFPKRLGSGEELAFMVMDLLTNPYMNAEVIRVDGGIRMPPK